MKCRIVRAALRGPGLVAIAIAAWVAFTFYAPDALAQLGPFGGARQAPPTGLVGWIIAEQAMFYRALSGTIRAAKTDGSALWVLMGISFLYGIFHAAGPGHGKAVISSYLVANEETWRRGISLSFASALLQALTAIVIVGVAAVLLGATAKVMGDATRAIEIVSYCLVVLLGARLLWVKGSRFVREIRNLQKSPHPAAVEASHQHHSHDHHHDHAPDNHAHDNHAHEPHSHGHDHHGHDHDAEPEVLPWGHAHGPEPGELAGPGGLKRGFSAIVAVGLRPCSGAILVLVFALAQGLFWAGVASTLVMGLGTAITVTAIATLAVAARGVAKRFTGASHGYGALALRGIEVGAAMLVLVFGVLLLTGYMASERLVGF